MESINAKYALVHKSDNGLRITLSKNKFCNATYGLYEDVKIVIENGTLTLDGLLHKREHLFSFDSEKFWIEYLTHKPLPEEENLIEEGYKNIIHRWKGIKSKFIPRFTTYTYDKVKKREKTNNFSLDYSPDGITEMNEDLKTFREFKDEFKANLV
jgi:hypothetical protein